MKSNFKFLPSFSVGAFGDGLRKNFRYSNGLTIRFYADDFPKEFQHNDFLISAGHLVKSEPECRKIMGLTDKNFVMGDSGGYQICAGSMKWDPKLRGTILEWLEHNSDVGMNLDIPPRVKYAGKFIECLDLSKENFKYFADNRTGSCELLNIIHGQDVVEFKKWYDTIKDFPFDGWAIGGSGGNLFKFFSGLAVLFEGKEHHKPTTNYIHILGSSRITYFFMLYQLQKSLEDLGLDIVVTSDSSAPDRAVVFGTYYTGYSFKKGTWQSINFPNEANHAELVDEFCNLSNLEFPYTTEFDKILRECVDFKDMKQLVGTEGKYSYGMRLHNFMFYTDVLRRIESIVYGHDYILQQSISKELYTILQSIDEMVKSDTPMRVYEKYKPLYMKMSNAKKQPSVNTGHKFF
jgi:hypothetical protein|tara:strand:+ start:3457 stop:4671 length:1215 start_codon:yes stop_codon:yes gene_type:complete